MEVLKDYVVDVEIELKRAILEIYESIVANAITPECERIIKRFQKDVDLYNQLRTE